MFEKKNSPSLTLSYLSLTHPLSSQTATSSSCEEKKSQREQKQSIYV